MLRRIIQYGIAIVWILNSNTVYSQTVPEDIVIKIQSTAEETQDSLYYELYAYYKFNDPDKAFKYAKNVYSLSKKYNHKQIYVKSLHAIGYFERKNNNLLGALEHFKEGLDLAYKIKYDIGVLMMLNDIGTIYYNQQQFDKAIDYYLKLIESARNYKQPYDEAIANNNIATIYKTLNNSSEAINYFLECIKIKKDNLIVEGLDLNYCNVGLCYIDLGENEKAIETFNYIKKICDSCDLSIKSYYFLGLGNAYFNLMKFDVALNNFYQSLSIAKLNQDNQRIINIYILLSKTYFETNLIYDSRMYLDSARNLSIKINDKVNLMNTYDIYSKLFQKEGDIKSALDYKERYIHLKDSIFKEELTSKIKNSFLSFQQSENDRVIKVKDTKIIRNKQFAYLITIIALLLLVVLAFSYRTLTYRRRLSERLDDLVGLKTKELTDSNTQIIRSRKELDTFLYRTSHDIRGPIATLMGLTNLALLETKDPVTESYLKRIDFTAGKLNEIISRLTNVSQITSMPLDIITVNIYSTVNEVIEDIRNHTGIDNGVHFKLTGIFPEEINTDKILLKIILTNLIENSFKFYDPDETDSVVELKITVNGKIDFSVIDNGSGINPEFKEKIFELFFVASERRGAGLGLYQAQLASQKLGGTISLTSYLKPTTFQLSLPVIN